MTLVPTGYEFEQTPPKDGMTPPFRAAYRKGQEARKAGEPRDACPYEDIRTWHGGVTWSRGFRRSWGYGWDAMQSQLEREHAGQPGRYPEG